MPKAHEKEWKKIVQGVKRSGSDANPYAVAHAAINKKYGSKKAKGKKGKKRRGAKNPFKNVRY